MAIRASVILVSFNSKDDLERCLPSLQSALTESDEVIVVDNASTDTSVEWLSQTYPEIRLIRNPQNMGFGSGANQGARHANGTYLVFLNPDTIVEQGWLDSLIGALETEPMAGLATSKILLLNNPDRINTCGNDMHISGLTLCRGMNQVRSAYSNQVEINAVSGSAFIIYKHLFSDLRGFDESFFMYMEDSDLSLRARLAGYRCIYTPKSIVYHDYALTIGRLKTYFEERNRYIMLLKCLRGNTLIGLLPSLLLAEVVTWGFSLLHDPRNISNKFNAYQWIIRHWNEIMRERQYVQKFRRVSDRHLLKSTHYRIGYEQTTNLLLSTITHLLFDPFFYITQRFALIF